MNLQIYKYCSLTHINTLFIKITQIDLLLQFAIKNIVCIVKYILCHKLYIVQWINSMYVLFEADLVHTFREYLLLKDR